MEIKWNTRVGKRTDAAKRKNTSQPFLGVSRNAFGERCVKETFGRLSVTKTTQRL